MYFLEGHTVRYLEIHLRHWSKTKKNLDQGLIFFVTYEDGLGWEFLSALVFYLICNSKLFKQEFNNFLADLHNIIFTISV